MSVSVKPQGAGAVMASRSEAPDSLDFFPTPPWATRALCDLVLPAFNLSIAGKRVWEPACGEGHMAEVLREYTGSAALVVASDVHDYGRGAVQIVGSYVGAGVDVLAEPHPGFDWVITNPPFNLAVEFAERAICETRNCALLVRTAWLEGGERYTRLFSTRAPAIIAQFSERVPMTKGRWDPRASTATAYAWIIWRYGRVGRTEFCWIPPGQRQRLTKPTDIERFAREST